MLKELIILLPVMLVSAGCVPRGAVTLQNLAQSRREMKQEVQKDEASFSVLLDDLKNNRLQKGMSEAEILARYGRPIFARPVNGGAEKSEVMLYRHPTEFFSSELVYLYFDQDKKLASWQVNPAK